MTDLLVAAVVVVASAIVQGVAGFAFGILSVAFLTLMWGGQSANVVVSILALWCCVQGLWTVRHSVHLRCLRPLFAGLMVGLPLGTWALISDDAEILLRYLVAGACVLVAAQNWLARPPEPDQGETAPALGFLAGIGSGFLAASVSSSAPPTLWYIYRRPWSREELKASTLAVFTTSTVVKMVLWVIHDLSTAADQHLLSPERLARSVILLPAAIVGTSLGVKLFRRVDREQLRRLVCVLLAIMAVIITVTTATR